MEIGKFENYICSYEELGPFQKEKENTNVECKLYSYKDADPSHEVGDQR